MKTSEFSWRAKTIAMNKKLTPGELQVIADTDIVQRGDASAMARELQEYRKAHTDLMMPSRISNIELRTPPGSGGHVPGNAASYVRPRRSAIT